MILQLYNHFSTTPSPSHLLITVVYDDDDVEILNLKMEKWEIIKLDANSDEEDGSDHTNPVGSADIESLCNENISKKLGQAKKKLRSANEGGGEDVSKMVSEGASVSKAKPEKDSLNKGSGTESDPDAKKHSAKKIEESKDGGGGGSSWWQSEPRRTRKGRGMGKLTLKIVLQNHLLKMRIRCEIN